jgi:multisubunit Na+/H+ antiporter MnhG subunit
MPVPPDTDHGLAHTADKQSTSGWRFLLIGGILFALGMIVMAAGEHVANFAGVALAALATPFTLLGLALVLSSIVSKRSAQHKPFV